MSRKMQEAVRWLEKVRKEEKLLSRLAEQDQDLYVLTLLNVYDGIPEKMIRGMRIEELNGIALHPTVKRVLETYTKGRSVKEYLIKSKLSSREPMSDMEYGLRRVCMGKWH